MICLGLVAMSACVDVMRPSSRSTAPAIERARAEVAAAERARQAARRGIAEDQRERPRVVDTEGAITRALYGPLRFEVERGAVRAADDIAPAPIDYVRRAARGWVFIARDAVFVSETFTGRLRPLVREGQLVVPEVSRDRVTLALHGGGMLWSDGATLHEFEDRDAVSLAWSDASRGAVILGHRALRATRDGGAHWRAIDLRGEVPVRVEGDDTGLRVVTHAGVHRIDDRDELTSAVVERPRATFLQCVAPTNEGPILRELEARTYDVAPEAPLAAQREGSDSRQSWRAPSFALDVPSVALTGADPTWSVPSPTRSVLGSREARTALDSSTVAAVASLTIDPHREGPQLISLAWRGEDSHGPFASRTRARTPVEILLGGQWVLVAATRSGLLFELSARPPGVRIGDDSALFRTELFWFGSNSVRRTPVTPGGAGNIDGSVALPDGSVIVLGRSLSERAKRCDGPIGEVWTWVAYALRLGPDGVERGRRAAVDDVASREVVGLGELDGRWGLVTAERADRERLTLLPLDGGEVPLGRWRFEDTPTACGARVDGVATLHIFGNSSDVGSPLRGVRIGPQPARNDFAEAISVSFERVGERACVRRVWATQRAGTFEFDFEDVRDLFGAVRFEARGDHLEGAFDDGERNASLRATIIAAPPLPHRVSDD